jgi:hypothetical protein
VDPTNPFSDLLSQQPRTGLLSPVQDAGGVPMPSPAPGPQVFRQQLDTGEEFFAPQMPTGFPDYPAQPQPGSTEFTPQPGVAQGPASVGPEQEGVQTEAPSGPLPTLAERLAQADAADAAAPPDLPAMENYTRALGSRIVDLVAQGSQMAPGQQAITGSLEQIVDNIATLTGVEWLKGSIKQPTPEALSEQFKANLKEVGLDLAHDAEAFSGKFGKESVDSAIMLMAMLRAAPHMAKVAGTTMPQRFIKRLGDSLQKHPWIAAITDPGSVAGGVAGEHFVGEGWQIPGAIAGGVGANAIAKAVMMPVKSMQKLINAASTRFANSTMPSTAPPAGATTALRDQAISPEDATSRVQVFAQNQIEGEVRRVEIELAQAIDQVTRSQIGVVRRGQNRGAPIVGTGTDMQERLAQHLDKVEEIAHKIEDRFWRRVPQKAKIPVSDLMQRVYGMVTDVANRQSQSSLPRQQIEEMLEALAPQRGEGGKMLPHVMTVEKLRAIRGAIRVARKTEQMAGLRKVEPNGKLIANMIDLEKWIDDAIADGLPPGKNVALDQARQYSYQMNEMFTRPGNPVADLLARRNRGEYGFSPEKFVEDLMKRYKGVESALNIGRSLNDMKNPQHVKPGSGPYHSQGMAYPGAATPTEKGELQQFETMMEDTIRTMFRDAADSMSPEQSAKWIARHENSIRPLAKVHGELLNTFTNLTRLTEERKLITESALHRAMGQDGKVAINKLFTDKNPALTARKLLHGENTHYTINGAPQQYSTEGLIKDPQALEGMRMGVIDEFFARSKMDPMRAEQMFKDPKVKRMLDIVLDKDQVARMGRMIDVSAKIEKGEVNTAREYLKPAAMVISRIIGANAGGAWAQAIGGGSGGSLQTAAIFSQAAQSTVRKALTGLDARTMLARAVIDPNAEKLLYSRLPVTPKGVAELEKTARRVVMGAEGLRQYAIPE